MNHNIPITSEMRECIDNCVECYKACLETAMYCATKGGRHAMPKHLSLLMECANICQTSANFMLMGSENHVLTCDACSQVCGQCAEECEEMNDDPAMKRCAELCRRCEESCRNMASSHV